MSDSPLAYGRAALVAHRGGLKEAPENTSVAFDAALACAVDGIELDVQVTRDDVVVLHHDADLRRICGERIRIADCSYAQLRRYEWGVWPDDAFAGQRILTLEDVMGRYSARTDLMVEIKSFPHDRGRTARITELVLDALRANADPLSTKRIFVLSFDAALLRDAHARDSTWPYVLNTMEPSRVMDEKAGEHEHLHALCAPIRTIRPDFVRFAHARNLQVMTWAVNTARQVSQALDAGVDVMMTDKPCWMVRYMRSREVEG